MRRFILYGLIAMSLLLAVRPAMAYELPKPKLIAVYFSASWCPNCKILGPVLDEARKTGELDNKAVLFVTLDLSDAASIHQSVMLAQSLGIAAYVQAQGSSTGYVALLAADTKTEITRFDRTSSVQAIVSGVNQALEAPCGKGQGKPLKPRLRSHKKVTRRHALPESCGALAQLVERFHGMEEVNGSTPLSSTTLRLRLRVAYAT